MVTATWAGERCVVARVGVADSRWLELADVAVCSRRSSWTEARGRALDVAARLPGCLVVAVPAPDACCVVVRGAFVRRLPVRTCAAVTAVWCYSRLSAARGRGGRGLPRLASRSRTCSACGRPDAR